MQCAWPAPLYNIISQTEWFSKKVTELKCVWIYSSNSVWNISHSKKKWASYYEMFIRFHVKYPLFLSDFNENSNFLDKFSKNPPTSNFRIIRPLEAEFFHADGRTDRHDEANSRFRNFANAPKNTPRNMHNYYGFIVLIWPALNQ